MQVIPPLGTPRPTVSWSKLEGPLPATASVGDGILIIPEARPEDAGTYRCTAANVAGSVQSQVQLFVQCEYLFTSVTGSVQLQPQLFIQCFLPPRNNWL